jgi:hypothetical protein
MLEIRPNCEYCDKDLAPDSTEAMICTYECTYCAPCVETHLHNVCPNCGGGFVPRPIRPKTAHRDGVSLAHQPASTKRVHLKQDKAALPDFVASLENSDPKDR